MIMYKICHMRENQQQTQKSMQKGIISLVIDEVGACMHHHHHRFCFPLID